MTFLCSSDKSRLSYWSLNFCSIRRAKIKTKYCIFKFFFRLLILVYFLWISCQKSAFLSSYTEKVLSWFKKSLSQESWYWCSFSYYDLGVAPSYIIHDTILFLSCGSSYYIVNLKEKSHIWITKLIICDIWELSLICFSLRGQKMWENDYRNIVCDWSIMNEGVKIIFENNEKLLVLFSNGNGIPVL